MEGGITKNLAYQSAKEAAEEALNPTEDGAAVAINAGASDGISETNQVAVELSDDAAAAAARATTTAAVQNARLTLATAYGLLTPSTVKCLGDTLRKSAQEMENRLH